MDKFEQNVIIDMANRGVDLAPRWKKILKEIAQNASFIPDEKILSQSQWYKRPGKVGAVHCPGTIKVGSKRKRVVLKIQGVKPNSSEIDLIKSFDKQNKSKVIRPPRIFWCQRWDERKQYEAFIMEETDGKPVIVNHPATDKELNDFFDLYKEYRKNCIKKAWVKRPTSYTYREQFDKWIEATKDQRDKDPFKDSGDEDLVERGIEILEKSYTLHELDFMHGHFQPGDLIVAKSGEVVLFSNLFWGWRNPFYDAVFGYHWWMLGMEHAKNFSEDLLEKERKRWLDKIYPLEDRKAISLALLERAIPALMVDRYFMDQTKPSAEIITKSARKELKRLLKELS